MIRKLTALFFLCAAASCEGSSSTMTMTAPGPGTDPSAAGSSPQATDAGDVATPEVAAAPAMGSSASYLVPAGPETPAMAYSLPVPRVDTTLGVLRVDYFLPELLAGQGQRISLRGALDATGHTATVSGAAGSATCELMPQDGIVLRCTENLPGVHVDLAAVERAARAAGVGNVAGYVAIAAWFASEPIGVLEVR